MHGLNHHEMRLLAEKVSDQPETLDTGDKLVEFSLPSWQVTELRGCQLFCHEIPVEYFTDPKRPGTTWIQGGYVKFDCYGIWEARHTVVSIFPKMKSGT